MGNLLKNTLKVSGLTIVSRIFGMVRDIIIAMLFGAGGASDAFFMAFRFPDLLRKLFSEGILSISFVPVFSKILGREGKSQAASMASSALLMVSVMVTFISLAGLFASPFIFRVFGQATVPSYQAGLTVILFKMMIPYLLVISLLSVCMGILNCLDEFWVPAAGPLVFNLVIIFFALIVSPKMDTPIMGIAAGVAVGGFFQLVFQIPFLVSHGVLSFKKIHFLHPEVLKVFKIMIPAMIGAAGYQINMMIGSWFAFFLENGNVSFLYYADRLVQFSLGIFTVSVATVIFPRLSQKAEQKQYDQIHAEFLKGVQLVFFITIPAMAGLIALRYQIVELLFHHGVFELAAVKETAQCLLFLAMGLWAFSGTRMMVTLSHSLSNIRWPCYAGVMSVFVNCVLCILLTPLLGLSGIAISISAAAIVNFLMLMYKMKPVSHADSGKMGVFFIKTIAASTAMYLCVKSAAVLIFYQDYGRNVLFCGVAGCILIGIMIYLGIYFMISGREMIMIKEIMRKK